MSYTHRLGEELDTLRRELSRLVDENGAAAVSASRERIDEAAKLLDGLMDEVEQLVAREEERIETLISSRPIMSIAAAFLTGVALGYILGRR
jgi:ElaB/YqjD/DUF883 family membrane-anchored ribosome-binding protein